MPERRASEPPADLPAPVQPRQLHAAAVPIWFMYDAGRFVFALLPAILVGGVQLALLIIVPFLIGAPIVRYMRFRYQLSDTTLTVEGGLINRWRRVIPQERVQSVDIVEKLRHRAFGVVEVRVEAIGGQQTEAALVALTRDEADRIRSWATATDESEAAGAPPEDHPVLARLSPGDLVVAGVTGGRVAVLAVLLGYAQEFLGEDTFEQARSFVRALMPNTSIVTAAAILVVGLILASLVLSVVATVLVYWEFTLTLEKDRLIIKRGLLERRRAQIPLRRIQAVEINQNILRRLLGLASLRVVVAGYTQEGQQSEETGMLLPIGRRASAWTIATRILGAPGSLAGIELQPRPRRSLSKNFALLAFPAALAGGIAAISLTAGSVIGALVPLLGLAAWLGHKVAGHGLTDHFVLVRSGVIVTTTAVVPRANLQHLRLSWTKVQRRYGLATLRLHIPKSVPRARDMDRDEARRWFHRLREPQAPSTPESSPRASESGGRSP